MSQDFKSTLRLALIIGTTLGMTLSTVGCSGGSGGGDGTSNDNVSGGGETGGGETGGGETGGGETGGGETGGGETGGGETGEVESNPIGTTQFSHNFDSGDLSAWTIIDDSQMTSNWSLSNGQLLQNIDVADKDFGRPLDESFKLGTMAILNGQNALTDYGFSVDLLGVTDSEDRSHYDGQDLGVVFRYQDVDNYYRVAFNSRDGYLRVEKKVNGTFTPLATTAQGYLDGTTVRLNVLVDGPIIRVVRDGATAFSVYDTSLSTGTVGLYAQDRARFDNLVVTAVPTVPVVSVSQPLPHTVIAGNQVDALVTVSGAPAESELTVLFDGLSCSNVTEAPAGSGRFSADCGAHATGTYSSSGRGFEVQLKDAEGTLLAQTEQFGIGVGGKSYLSLGDSITNGAFDAHAEDNVSADGRIIAQQGYQAPLNDLLEAQTGTPSIVYNNATGGDRTRDSVVRIDSILARHSDTTDALMMLGINDVFDGAGAPSYSSRMQSLVDTLATDGRRVWVAQFPPALPLADFPTQNQQVIDFNAIIANLSNTQGGPDFYSFFYDAGLNYERESLYHDNLHPNALGQRIMATLWTNTLTGSNLQPFFLDRLCNRLVSVDCSASSPTNHKQTLLASVYPTYYVDSEAEIVSSPSYLAEGIWIKTAATEASSVATDYIYFEVDRAVTVYVAYDAGAASLPAWLNSFTATGDSITTTDTNGATLNLYAATFAANSSVSLGGNMAVGAAGADANYVVIVVEN